MNRCAGRANDFGASAAIEARDDMPIWPAEVAARAPYLSAARIHLGDVAFAAAFALGQSLMLEQSVAETMRIL